MKAHTLIKQWLSSPAHRLIHVFLIVTLGLGVFWWVIRAQPAQADPAFIYVRPDGDDSACNGEYNAPATASPNCAVQTIGQGVYSVTLGGTVSVAAGTYPEDVTVNKALSLQGANPPDGPDAAIVAGRITIPGAGTGAIVRQLRIVPGAVTGDDAAISVNASNVTISANLIDGITGDGTGTVKGIHLYNGAVPAIVNIVVTTNTLQNVTNPPGGGGSYGGADGIMVQGVVDGVALRANTIQTMTSAGWAYGIEIAPTGSAPSNPPTNITAEQNAISNVNYGVVYGTNVMDDPSAAPFPGLGIAIDTVGATSADASQVTAFGNAFSSLHAPLGNKDIAHALNASGNYLGYADPATLAQVISPTLVGRIDYTPWLAHDTDIAPGTSGFQGDFSALWVGPHNEQTGAVGRIQEGVDLVTTGGTINVAAGTYRELIAVTKSSTLVGEPGVVIQPSENIPDFGSNHDGAIIWVQAPDVTIRDVLIDGDNPVISGGHSCSGADINALRGIYMSATAYDHLRVENVALHNLGRGINLYGGQNHTLRNNVAYNLGGPDDGDYGYGILLNNNTSAQITDNVIDLVLIAGIFVQNNYSANPITITGNTVSDARIGLGWNMLYGGGSGLVVNNTVIGGEVGMQVTSITNGYLEVRDNTFTLPTENYEIGFLVWNTRPQLALIIDNTINGSDVGVLLGDVHPTFGANQTHVQLTGNTIDGAHTGIGVSSNSIDYSVSLTATNNIIRNTTAGLSLAGAETIEHVTFAGNTLDNLTTVFSVSTTGDLYAYANSITNFAAGIIDPGAVLNARHNWWGTYDTQPAAVNDDSWNYRLGAPVDTWGIGTLADATLTSAGGTGTGVIVSHGYGTARAPFGQVTLPYGGAPCSDYYDFFVLNAVGSWALQVPLTTTVPGCTVGDQTLYRFALTGGGWPDTSCSGAACWLTPPGVTQNGDVLGVTVNAETLLQGTPFVAGNGLADLVVSKSDSRTTVQPGETLAYLITITNTGNVPATVSVTDTLPAHTAFLVASDGGAETTSGSGVVTWPEFSLAGGGARVTRLVVVTVGGALPAGVNAITNTVTITTPNEASATDNTAQDIDQVNAAPDLILSKIDSGVLATPGETLVYTLTYANAGTQGATGVIITETVPAHTAFNSTSSTPGWTCVDTTCTFLIGALAAGGSDNVQFAVTINTPLPAGITQIDNTATIADDGDNGVDPTPANNTATTTTAVLATPILAMSKSDGENTVEPGDTLVYTLTITNTGDQDAAGVAVTDVLPAHTDFVSASDGGSLIAPGVVTWPPFALYGGGASATRALTVRVANPFPADTNRITNTATVADEGITYATAVDVDVINAASLLALSKDDGITTVTPGSTLIYRLVITNSGNQLAAGIVLTDTLPEHSTFSLASHDGEETAPGIVTWPAFDLPGGGASTTRLLVVTVDNPLPAGVTAITNTAVLRDNRGSMAAAEDSDIVEANPDFILSKTSAVTTTTPGATLSYAITITNTGNQGATGVLITDTLPNDAAYAGASNGGGETFPGSGIVTWPPFPLVSGVSVTYYLTVTVSATIPAGTEMLVNTVDAGDDQGHTATNQHAAIIEATPDLAIGKTDGVSTVEPGDTLVYTLSVTNSGDQGATGVRITDYLPAHTAFVAASDGGTQTAPGVIAWPAFDLLGGGASVTRVLTVTLYTPLPADTNAITNTATVADDAANGPDPTPLNNSAEDVDAVFATPHLVIAKSDDVTTAYPGDTLTYRIILTNTGNLEATDTLITDTLPAHTRFIVASDGGVETAGVVAWPIFNLPGGGASTTRLLIVTVDDPLPAGADAITNTVAAIAPGQTTLTATQDIDAVSAAPDLALSKSASSVTVEPGETLTYTLTYANLGNQEATGVVITETVPAYTTFAGPSGWSCAGATCTYSVGSLPAGATRSVTFTVNSDPALPAGITEIANTAAIADDGDNGADTNLANNTDSTITSVIATPDLALTKSDGGVITQPGATLIYTLTFTNTGNQEATGPVIAETVPAHTTFAGPTGWSCVDATCEYDLGALPANASGAVTFNVTIIDPLPAGITHINNTAAITDDGSNGADPTPANNTATITTLVEATPDLAIGKTDGVSTVEPGNTLVYTLNVTNSGGQGATGVRITDHLPAHTAFVAASDGGTQTAPGVITWPTFDLPGGGASVTRVLTVTLDTPFPVDTNIITNTATVADDAANGPDPTPLNNSAEDVDAVFAAPILALSKSNDVTTVTPGSTLIYRLVITNSGSQLAAGILLTDTLPEHTAFYLASDAGQETTPGSVTWPAFDLPGGASATRLLVLTVDNPLPAGVTTLTNNAALHDNRGNMAAAQDTDAVDANPLLALDKTNAVDTTLPGATLVYTLTLTNNGNQEATAILLTDTLSADVAFVTASDGGYTTSASLVAWPPFNLAGGGASVTYYLTVTVNPTLPAGLDLLINAAQASDDRGYTAFAQHADAINAAPDLAIDKTDNGIAPQPGDALLYTLTYENVGEQGATSAVIAETVPAYTTFDAAASSSGWTCADGASAGTPCAYTIDDLPATASGNITFAVRVASPLPAFAKDTANTVSIADDGNNGADIDPANNTASIITPFDATIDLLITKDDSEITVEPGETIVYTLTYANNGNQLAGGAVITEIVPALTTFNQIASSSGWTCAHGALAGTACTYPLGDVIEGGALLFAVDVVLPFPVEISEITNEAVIGADANNIPDANPADNTATAITPIITRPDLVIGKDNGFSVVLPDQRLTYVITITNVGTQNATNVQIVDTLPAHVAFAGASDGGIQSAPGIVTWPTIPQITLDETVTRTLSVIVNSALPAGVSQITNTITASDDETHGPDLNPNNNTATDVDFVGAMPDLVLDKTVDRAVTYPQSTLAYTIHVENTGSQGATGVTIIDNLPIDMQFVGASDNGYESAPGVVVWPAFTLNAGEAAVRTLTVQSTSILPEGYVLTNTAAVSDDGANGEDPAPENNTDTATSIVEWPVIYLPLVLRNYAIGPDLIIESIVIGNGNIAITIRNQGKLAVPDTLGFWVDLYINPTPAPTRVNQTWDPISPYGAAWGVDREAIPILPGEVRTLYLYDIYYKPNYSRLPVALRAGDIIYVQVDSYHAATTYGVVLEDHELSGTAYNNIVRLVVDSYSPLNPVMSMQSMPVSPASSAMPERP